MIPYKTYLACFFIAALISLAFTPLVIRLARALGAIDRPVDRKIHKRPVPRLGGVSVFVSMWVPLILLCFYDNIVVQQVLTHELQLLLTFTGGLAMLCVGIVDDIHGINARWKFAFQFPVAILLVAGGVRFDSVYMPLVGHFDLGFLGPFISVFWLVGATNAMNLIDGIDGLAAGVAYLIATSLAILAIQAGNMAMLVVVMSALAGACLGFLRYNVQPARIFLGDSGSLFLGMTLAISATFGSVKDKVGTSLLVPAVLIGYPIADTLISMARRYLRGKPVFTGDASHLHHRLLYKGMDHRHACQVMYGVCLVFCLWAFAIQRQSLPLMMLGMVSVAMLIVFGLYRLGYLEYFQSEKVARERNAFKAVNYYAEMIKAKIQLAQNRDDLVRLLQDASEEYRQLALEVFIPSSILGDALAVSPSSRSTLADTAVQDRYHYDNTGFGVTAHYAAKTAKEELILEQRRLFGEICAAANHCLVELTEAAHKDPQPRPGTTGTSVPDQAVGHKRDWDLGPRT
ncbi:MAG TPA: MraY family glycosyltransferase [Candidatus Paceibacterota bacterium]|nr:MraY family glycosyltransferase [Verrucomicrobiota bacterium]HRY47662.1 MraY family glycosyltransferase [Candidatus Paceibacterota bacterium]HSA01219.1 MraY family glycosyltransferase [Candidatus Paceibacterota bacterium]